LENDNSVGAVQVRSKWAFFLLAATAVLFGQRAEASRTPLTDFRAAPATRAGKSFVDFISCKVKH
jgi:hypothetical protein